MSTNACHLSPCDSAPGLILPRGAAGSAGPGVLPAVDVRYYERDGSVFLDTHYLIKGVAGAIFWKLASEGSQQQRREFSLRELRLAGAELRLPVVQDNLSTRLLLLQRRLAERHAVMQIHKAGRGRFRIELRQPLRLTAVPDPSRLVGPAFAGTGATQPLARGPQPISPGSGGTVAAPPHP